MSQGGGMPDLVPYRLDEVHLIVGLMVRALDIEVLASVGGDCADIEELERRSRYLPVAGVQPSTLGHISACAWPNTVNRLGRGFVNAPRVGSCQAV